MYIREMQKKTNSIPGICIPGISIPGTPISNFTGTWHEVPKINTTWEYAKTMPNGIIYSK